MLVTATAGSERSSSESEAHVRRKRMVYFGSWLMMAINYMDRAALSVALPALVVQFGLTDIESGLVLSAFMWSYTLANLPGAMLLDRFGVRAVGSASVAIWSVAMMLGGLAGSLGAFLWTRILLGIGEAPSYALTAKVVRIWAPRREWGFATTLLASGQQFGLAFGSFAGGLLVSLLTWRGEFLALGLVGLAFAALWPLLYRDDPGAQTVRSVGIRESWQSLRALRSASFMRIVVATCCSNYVAYFLMSWLPIYLVRSQGMGVVQSGAWTGLCYLLTCAVAIPLSRFADRVAAKGRLGRPLLAALLFVAPVVLVAANWTHAIFAVVFVVVLASSFNVVGAAVANAVVSELLIDGRRIGALSGIKLTIANTAGIAAPILTGVIVQASGGFDLVFYLAGAMPLAAAAIMACGAMRPIAVNADDEIGEGAPAAD